MSLGTLTQSYYLKDDLLFDPPGVRAHAWPPTQPICIAGNFLEEPADISHGFSQP